MNFTFHQYDLECWEGEIYCIVVDVDVSAFFFFWKNRVGSDEISILLKMEALQILYAREKIFLWRTAWQNYWRLPDHLEPKTEKKIEWTKLISINLGLDDNANIEWNSYLSKKTRCARFFTAKCMCLRAWTQINRSQWIKCLFRIFHFLYVFYGTNSMHVWNEWLLLPKLMCN